MRDVSMPGPVEVVARKLRATADLYQMPDGQPGERGYGCWGWRTIAEELRRVAAEVEREVRCDT